MFAGPSSSDRFGMQSREKEKRDGCGQHADSHRPGGGCHWGIRLCSRALTAADVSMRRTPIACCVPESSPAHSAIFGARATLVGSSRMPQGLATGTHLGRGATAIGRPIRMDEEPLLAGSGRIFMRDPTRGGLATVAHELARAAGVTVHLSEDQNSSSARCPANAVSTTTWSAPVRTLQSVRRAVRAVAAH